jgi:hypothetical protein
MPLAGGDGNQLPPSLPAILINIDHFAKVHDGRTCQVCNRLIGIPLHEIRRCSKLNIGSETDVVDCSRTPRAALASFRRPQIATRAELGPRVGHSEGRLELRKSPTHGRNQLANSGLNPGPVPGGMYDAWISTVTEARALRGRSDRLPRCGQRLRAWQRLPGNRGRTGGLRNHRRRFPDWPI